MSTTVDRAGSLLLLLAENPEGLGITDLTRRLSTQRAPLYRILQALIEHRLVRRDSNKRYLLGVGTLQLARAYEAQLPVGVDPLLRRLADQTGLTASLVSAEGETLTTIVSMPPSTDGEHVFTPPGYRHPEGPLAIRMALAASRPPEPDESEEVTAARDRGYAIARTAVGRMPYAIATVVPGGDPEAIVILALVSLGAFDVERAAEPLVRTAQAIAHWINRR